MKSLPYMKILSIAIYIFSLRYFKQYIIQSRMNLPLISKTSDNNTHTLMQEICHSILRLDLTAETKHLASKIFQNA